MLLLLVEAQHSANTADTTALMCYIWHVPTRRLCHRHSNCCLILPDTPKPGIDPQGVIPRLFGYHCLIPQSLVSIPEVPFSPTFP